MAPARNADGAHAIGAAAELTRLRLEPADGVVDVDEGRGIAQVGRHPEVEGGHDDAALRQGLVHRHVIGAVAVAPGTPVEIHHHRKGALPLGAEQAREERLVAVAEILDVVDRDLVHVGGSCRVGGLGLGRP